MPEKRARRRTRRQPPANQRETLPEFQTGYWAEARRPLSVLIFLLPLIAAYEICLALVLRSEDGRSVSTVAAHENLLRFFNSFGIGTEGGLYLGGIVIVVVLILWHFLARDPVRVRPIVIGLMALESLALTIPLLVAGDLVTLAILPAVNPTGGGIPADLASMNLLSRLAISVGAGLYEELIFRMVLIAVLHTLLVDVVGMTHRVGVTISVILSAGAFMWYHDLAGPEGTLSWRRAGFFFIAGFYFGTVFAARGFGIVVGVHALYDVVTVLGYESASD